jgi:hypothetical protein
MLALEKEQSAPGAQTFYMGYIATCMLYNPEMELLSSASCMLPFGDP